MLGFRDIGQPYFFRATLLPNGAGTTLGAANGT